MVRKLRWVLLAMKAYCGRPTTHIAHLKKVRELLLLVLAAIDHSFNLI